MDPADAAAVHAMVFEAVDVPLEKWSACRVGSVHEHVREPDFQRAFSNQCGQNSKFEPGPKHYADSSANKSVMQSVM